MESAQRKENSDQPFWLGNGYRRSVGLKKYGLDPAKDVIIVQLGTQPNRFQALAAGAIDATIISPPLDIAAKKQGYPIVVNIAELGIPYPQQVIETTDRFIRESPHTVKSFLKGFIEGVRFALTHKEETKKIITKYLKTTDPEILEATYQSFVQATDQSGYPNMEGMRNAMDEVAARVPAIKNKKPEDFVNTHVLRELDKEGFFKRITRMIHKLSATFAQHQRPESVPGQS